MEKPYVKPTLDLVKCQLNDVILASNVIPTEEYEVPIKRIMRQELQGGGALAPEETEPPLP